MKKLLMLQSTTTAVAIELLARCYLMDEETINAANATAMAIDLLLLNRHWKKLLMLLLQ